MSHRPVRERQASRAAAVGATLAAAAALVVAGPVGAAQASAKVVISNVSVSPATFTLTQDQTATATVTFRLRVPKGQQRSYRAHDGVRTVPAVVEPGGGTLGVRRKVASLISGSLTDGIWRARVPVAASLDGSHDLAVEVCPRGTHCNRGGPQTHPLGITITVDGTHAPVLADLVQSPVRLPHGQTHGAQAIGHVVYAGGSTPASGIDIALVRAGGRPAVVAHTDGQGRFIAPWPWADRRSGVAGTLLVRVAGATGSVVSDTRTLNTPRSRFALNVRHPPYAMAGGRYVVTGTVSPGYPAAMLGHVSLQRLVSGKWRTVDVAHVRPQRRNGKLLPRAQFHLSTRFTSLGTATLRVTKSDAMCHGGRCRITGDIDSRFTMVTGSRNELVEQQLARFGYPVGAVDGTIDARARQALCAWRDVQGQKATRNGVTNAIARSILNAPRAPRANRIDGLYVSKTCQVLFQVVHGRYRRIVWASTGMPGLDTPSVVGAIFRKVDGPVESTLYPGAFMYWPMFFNPARPAIALHGSVSNDLVLPYPASHGCIRVWRPDIHAIFNESPLGTRVVVYGRY